MPIEFIKAPDVARLLGVDKEWVYQQTRLGILPHVKIGRHYRYTREGIERWASEQERQSTAAA